MNRSRRLEIPWSLLGLLLAATVPIGAEDSQPVFEEVAARVGLDFVHFNGMSGELFFSEMMGSGAALFDYDRDGDLDVYLVQGKMLGLDEDLAKATYPPVHPVPLTDRLYRCDLESDGLGVSRLRFVDVTESSGLEANGYGMGVTTGDVDNDGWVDLYVTNAGHNQLWLNNGDGTFRDATSASRTDDERWSVAAVFFDYDRDGWLDLYVGNYVEYRIALDKECISETGIRDYCAPLSYLPERDSLFRNLGDGRFEDVSESSGVGIDPANGLGAVANDFDADGWPDLYVANDQVPNFLWINRGDGTFVNNALLAGTAVNELGQPQASMGVEVGDLDGDGYDDLFMTHIRRETNALFLSEGAGMFLDSSRTSGAGMPSWQYTGFGTAMIDYDLDGWLDLYVANGTVGLIEELVEQGDPYPLHQVNQLLRNLGGGRFMDVSAEAGESFGLSEVSRGVAAGDIDNDGDPDLLVANNAGPARLLRNRGGEAYPWLGLVLTRGWLGRFDYGARVELERAGGPSLWRQVRTDGSYASARDPRLLFGLRDTQGGEELRIHWTEERARIVRRPPAGVYLVFTSSVGDTEP